MLALVVDEEALIRMDAVDCVEAAGYDVIEAANAEEALKIIELSPRWSCFSRM